MAASPAARASFLRESVTPFASHWQHFHRPSILQGRPSRVFFRCFSKPAFNVCRLAREPVTADGRQGGGADCRCGNENGLTAVDSNRKLHEPRAMR